MALRNQDWSDPAVPTTPDRDESREEVDSDRYPPVPRVFKVDSLSTFRQADPGLYKDFENVLGALRQEMLPIDVQEMLVEAMSESVRRELVYRMSGMETSVLTAIKQQIQLIDAVLKRVLNTDGTSNKNSGVDISPKEAMTLSMRLTQAMATHLPKLIKVDRIQRFEQALAEVMETELTKVQQQRVLAALDRLSAEDNER